MRDLDSDDVLVKIIFYDVDGGKMIHLIKTIKGQRVDDIKLSGPWSIKSDGRYSDGPDSKILIKNAGAEQLNP